VEVLDVIKIIGPLLAIFGVFKIFADVLNARSTRRRENYKLTKEYMVDLEDENQHQFLIQNGFLAITGHIASVTEIKFLLSKENPFSIIDLKPSGERFIYFDKDQGKYKWKQFYCSQKFQKFGWWFFNLIYAVLIIFAMLPHLGGVKTITINNSWIFPSLVFFVLAITALNFSDNFNQAKKFMRLNEKVNNLN